ncbi:uncharacterized protein M6B38_149255 [Iris pallida]|uniref:Uncharacterized protein n=1 Tax=Iris pallida TaxID=29817 RepID=A0AAX6F7G1_IRIPA|nr:uncharacterized protein M6B38_149255 [Iris pallida]
MGWANIYKRRLKVFTVALVVYLDYKATQNRAKWVNGAEKDVLWGKTHRRNARRVLNLIIELEGLWVKLGQYLSTRADVLPEVYICLLRQLQDSLPPRPLREVRRTIEKQLGKSMNDLFSNFVETPLATASIAQVHRATLRDGQEVVVKVQHDGIKEVILEDLKNAKSIVDWIAWAEPQYDFKPMIDEWCKEAPKELDFNNEAENTRKVSKNLRCRTDQDNAKQFNKLDVLIPEVIKSAERVLVLQYMDGIRLNDSESLEAYDVDKQKLVEEITRAYAHQIYVDGFFNGDPHPGNFLVSKEPPYRPILLDFGLTKAISNSMKQALAKMFLACAEGDHVGLLSAFTEMGLKLRIDMPEQVMDVTSVFFRTSTPANEALENVQSMVDHREKNIKALQEKMNLSQKEVRHFNPVDAFPGDAVIFMRVVNLLRGISSTLNVRIVYMDIMRPFAESTLLGNLRAGPATDTQWIYDSPVHSHVEEKMRKLLVELGKNKILGIQVCAYKGGHVIIDTAAGVLGQYDPRPVQPDTLFPVFSVTKGITAGMVHWLVDKGKFKLEETIANIWPDFGTCGKDLVKVHHILNHTSGLHNVMGDIVKTNPFLMCDWEKSLQHISNSALETDPGAQQQYHYLSFGWLCGGLIEHASGKKFQEVLEEAIIHPLNIEGELYIGIPPGVESRLVTLALDTDDLEKMKEYMSRPDVPDSLKQGNWIEMVSGLRILFNTLNIRRAIIPAANGHVSARALARYYATLAAGGVVPPPHSSSTAPPLGSRVHIPKFPSFDPKEKKSIKDLAKGKNSILNVSGENNGYTLVDVCGDDEVDAGSKVKRIFSNPNIHDELMGVGDFSSLVIPNGQFGLGFRRYKSSSSGKMMSFGHSGIGGSTGFCDIENDFAIAVTVNKMSLGGVTRSIIQLVCSELNVPLPEEFSQSGQKGPDMQLSVGQLS